jgi:hypothetical protein
MHGIRPCFFVSLQAVLQLTSIVLNNIRDKNTKTQQYYKLEKYIEKHSTPDDTVQLFGYAPACDFKLSHETLDSIEIQLFCQRKIFR